MMILSDRPSWASILLTTFVAIVLSTVIVILWRRRRRRTRMQRRNGITVSEICVYPIKSCAPMKVSKASVTETGFLFDRFAQVSDSDGNFLTPRDNSNVKLFHLKPSIVHEGSICHLDLAMCGVQAEKTFRIENLPKAIESAPAKQVRPIVGPNVRLKDLGDEVASWLSRVTRIKDCRLTAIGDGYHRVVEMNPNQGEPVPQISHGNSPPEMSLADEAPFLLTTTSSLEDLNDRLEARGKAKVSMQRFRPNIVVKGTIPWEEDSWKRIRIGGVEFEVWQRCGRCAMTTIDRETLQRGPEPLATLSTFRERQNGQRNFGMHIIPILAHRKTTYEVVTVGHTIEVLEYDEKRLEEWRRLFA